MLHNNKRHGPKRKTLCGSYQLEPVSKRLNHQWKDDEHDALLEIVDCYKLLEKRELGWYDTLNSLKTQFPGRFEHIQQSSVRTRYHMLTKKRHERSERSERDHSTLLITHTCSDYGMIVIPFEFLYDGSDTIIPKRVFVFAPHLTWPKLW